MPLGHLAAPASGRRAFARAYTDSLEGRGGGFVRAVAPEHVSAALNLVIAALIFAPRFDIDVPAPKFSLD